MAFGWHAGAVVRRRQRLGASLRPRHRVTIAEAGFDPDQPRDETGKWTDAEGGVSAPSDAASRMAVAAYKGINYSEVNGYLRTRLRDFVGTTPEMIARVKADIRAIDAGMQPTSRGGTLYRGVSGDVFGEIDYTATPDPQQQTFDRLTQMTTFTEPGYSSTYPVKSADRNYLYEHADVKMRISAPKGTMALNVPDLSGQEPEVLLARGTTFKITNVEWESTDPWATFNAILLDVTVVDQRQRPIEANFDPDQPRDEQGRWSGDGGWSVAPLPPGTSHGDTFTLARSDALAHAMGADRVEYTRETRPDLYMTHPVSGYTVRNATPAPTVKEGGYGEPPRIVDTVPGRFGMSDQVVPGSERPPDYLFRAISEEDWEHIQAVGYMKSDERMNLGPEGTVASLGWPGWYLPGNLASNEPGRYTGRIVRIAYRDEDGWVKARDGYIKTQQRVPLSQIDMVSPPITTIVPHGAEAWQRDTIFEAYDPEQPREPAGSPEGGQWTDEGGSDYAYNPADDRGPLVAAGFTGLGRGVTLSPDEFSATARRAAVRTLATLGRAFPATAAYINGVGADPTADPFAPPARWDPETRSLLFNPYIFGEDDQMAWQAARAEGMKNGDTPPTVDASREGMIIHEFGHAIEQKAGVYTERGVPNPIPSIRLASPYSGQEQRMAMEEGLPTFLVRVMNIVGINPPSEYAMSSPSEAFAEMFAAYQSGKAPLTERQREIVVAVIAAAEGKVAEAYAATQEVDNDRSDPADLRLLLAARSGYARRVAQTAVRSVPRRRARGHPEEQGRPPKALPGRRRQAVRPEPGVRQPLLRLTEAGFDPDQPRDEQGRWSADGGMEAQADALLAVRAAQWATNFAKPRLGPPQPLEPGAPARTDTEYRQAQAIRRWQSTFEDVRYMQTHPESEASQDFAEAVNASPPISGMVYRGVEAGGREFEAGDRVTFYNPVSVSPEMGVAHEFGDTLFEIIGADARDISRFSHFPQFPEGIVKPSRFSVVSVRESGIYTTPTGKGAFDSTPKKIITLVAVPEWMP